MAGVHFSFDNFEQLLDLSIGISDRLDENRAESFTVMYCDFSSISDEIISNSLEHVLRNSDSIVNCEKDYFFVLLYTDKYGADIVKNMFEVFFDKKIDTIAVSYPRDAETSKKLLEEIQDNASAASHNDIKCLDRFTSII